LAAKIPNQCLPAHNIYSTSILYSLAPRSIWFAQFFSSCPYWTIQTLNNSLRKYKDGIPFSSLLSPAICYLIFYAIWADPSSKKSDNFIFLFYFITIYYKNGN